MTNMVLFKSPGCSVGCRADAKEISRCQRGAPDQPTIYVRLREQVRSIGRFDTSAVKQSGQTGNHSIFFFELATDERMDLLRLLRRGGMPGADGPDGLVRDDGRIEALDAV